MRKVFKIIFIVFFVFVVTIFGLYLLGSRKGTNVKIEKIGVAVEFPAGFPTPTFVDQRPELQKLEYRKGYTEGGLWKSSRRNIALGFQYTQCKPPPDCKLELGELVFSLSSKDVELISKENPTINGIQAVDFTIARKRKDNGVQTFMKKQALPYHGYFFAVIAETTRKEDLDSSIVKSFFDSMTFPDEEGTPRVDQENSTKDNSDSKYINPILGYSITVPKNYHTAENYWGENSFVLWSGPSNKGFPAFSYPFVGVKIDPSKGKTLDQTIADFKDLLTKTGGEIKIFEKIVLNNGRQAYLIEFISINQSTKDEFKTRDVYTEKNGYIYRVGVMATPDDWRKEGDIWVEIINSFEI